MLDRAKAKQLDLLAVDVEGWELEVLRGFDFDRWEPKVIIVENLSSNPEYREYMKTKGYQRDAFIHINEIYTKVC